MPVSCQQRCVCVAGEGHSLLTVFIIAAIPFRGLSVSRGFPVANAHIKAAPGSHSALTPDFPHLTIQSFNMQLYRALELQYLGATFGVPASLIHVKHPICRSITEANLVRCPYLAKQIDPQSAFWHYDEGHSAIKQRDNFPIAQPRLDCGLLKMCCFIRTHTKGKRTLKSKELVFARPQSIHVNSVSTCHFYSTRMFY